MIEELTLKVFWAAMLLCAGSALILIWFDKLMPEEIVLTFFIIGLANLLIWLPIVIYRFLEKKKAV